MNYRQKIYSAYLSNRQFPTLDVKSLKSVTVWYEKNILPVVPKDKDIKILELGCGPGYFLYVLEKSGYKYIEGVDIGKEQLTVAEKLGVADYIIQQDVLAFLKAQRELYDVICAFDLLEHFTKDELLELLELIYHCLKPGGFFIFRSPNGESLFPGRIRYGDITHELSFTRNSMAQVLKATGFSSMEFHSIKPVVHGFKSLVRRIIFEIFEKAFWLYLIAETGDAKGYILAQNLWGWARK